MVQIESSKKIIISNTWVFSVRILNFPHHFSQEQSQWYRNYQQPPRSKIDCVMRSKEVKGRTFPWRILVLQTIVLWWTLQECLQLLPQDWKLKSIFNFINKCQYLRSNFYAFKKPYRLQIFTDLQGKKKIIL